MDIELNTLLVALMFVTILCMGIGNLLVTLADVVNHASASRRSRVHLSWMALLLLSHFNLFWNTKEILNVEHWRFLGFLLTVGGPVLLFFATSVLLTSPNEEDERDLDAFFLRLGRPFFLMLAAVQIWLLGAGYTLSGGFVAQDVLNALVVLLLLGLAASRSLKAHSIGAGVVWLLTVGVLVIRWLSRGPA